MNWFGMRAPRVLVLAAVVSSPLLSPFSSATKETTTLSKETIQQLEKDVPALMKKDKVPGLAIDVIRAGKTTWVHGFGMKEAKTGQPVTEKTVFEAASLSKPVFAYGVLKLVEPGKLELDVPLTN